MAKKPLAYVLYEHIAGTGSLKGKTVIQARATGRHRISHRDFCEAVARATTFTGAEVEAVLRLSAQVAKTYVENGDIVDFGDLGSLRPSFQSKLVEKGVDTFDAHKHIVRPRVSLVPSRTYFALQGVNYERVTAPAQKEKKGKTTVTPET